MVAVTKAAGNWTAPVTLAAGVEASGLANMTAQYLEQLLAGSPEKRANAASLHGRLGLHAREGNVQVTIVFGEHGIVIEEGLRDPDAVIGGPVETLMNLLSGKANPVWMLCRGGLAVLPTLKRPLFIHQTFRVMRLPAASSWMGLPPKVAFAVAGTVAVAVAVLLMGWVR